MTYTLLPNQTLLDATLTTTGTLENLCAIAFANGYSPTDDVAPGTLLTIPAGLPADTNTLATLGTSHTIATQGQSVTTGIFTGEFADTFQ